MLISNERYEFTPPDGDARQPIVVLGLQEYSPGQARKVDVWKLELPTTYTGRFGEHVEFQSFSAVLAALANQFCDGDEAKARERLIARKADSA